MRTASFIFIALIVAILFANILKANSSIARHSVPIAVYTTLYPFPFHIESSYSDGAFQGVEVGGSMSKTIAVLANDSRCRVLMDGRLVELPDVDLTAYSDGELIMRCESGGVAWNQIFVIQAGVVQQIRISGGLWL